MLLTKGKASGSISPLLAAKWVLINLRKPLNDVAPPPGNYNMHIIQNGAQVEKLNHEGEHWSNKKH